MFASLTIPVISFIQEKNVIVYLIISSLQWFHLFLPYSVYSFKLVFEALNKITKRLHSHKLVGLLCLLNAHYTLTHKNTRKTKIAVYKNIIFN